MPKRAFFVRRDNLARKKESKGIKEYAADLVERYNRWNQLYTHGGSDPFWADGSNLMLVRNHILYAKGELKEYCEKNNLELPNEYFFPTPDEVDRDYMARKDEIIEKAKADFEVISNDEDFKYLQGTYSLINDKKVREEARSIVLRLEPNLSDLVALRRYNRSFEWDMKRLKEFMEQHRDSMLLGFNTADHDQDEKSEDEYYEEEDDDYLLEEE